jgi:ABC-type branched-subunit amino acid transport system ATPase component
LLLIDELSLGLSPVLVEQALDLVESLNRTGTTVVLVEQSVTIALAVADRAVFLEKGTVRFDGQAKDLLARDDLVRAVFLGGARG